MSRKPHNIHKKFGLPPGSTVYTGRKKTEAVHISIIRYSQDEYEVKESLDIKSCFPYRDSTGTSWISVSGLHETEKINALTNHFGIHPLICEDILNIQQRPKIEFFDNYLFVTLKILDYEPEKYHIGIDQVSLILGNSYVISFQEAHEPLFDPLKVRIREQKGRIRSRNADYLLYAILDIIIDHYFLNLEKIGDHLEKVEQQLITDPNPNTLKEIYQLKRELLFLRKSVWPLRESISKLTKSESSLINEKNVPYLHDLYDHIIQVLDNVDTIRDLLSGMLDLFMSTISNRMNQVMKMLTVIATIFIPLTFIVGIYGMNFEYMPELSWRFGYFIVLGIMLGIALGMLYWFQKNRWI